MIYRVIFEIRYAEAYFDFETFYEAGEFAKKMFEHQTENEDSKVNSKVTIRIINSNAEKEDE